MIKVYGLNIIYMLDPESEIEDFDDVEEDGLFYHEEWDQTSQFDEDEEEYPLRDSLEVVSRTECVLGMWALKNIVKNRNLDAKNDHFDIPVDIQRYIVQFLGFSILSKEYRENTNRSTDIFGVTSDFLVEFLEDFDVPCGSTVEELIQNVICPQSNASRLSFLFARMLFQEKYANKYHVMNENTHLNTAFVVCPHDLPVSVLLGSLKSFEKTKVYPCVFWIDIFCASQHKTYCPNTFISAVDSIFEANPRSTLCIPMYPLLSKPLAFNRMRCLYEIFEALSRKMDVVCCLDVDEITQITEKVGNQFPPPDSPFWEPYKSSIQSQVDFENSGVLSHAENVAIYAHINCSSNSIKCINSKIESYVWDSFVETIRAVFVARGRRFLSMFFP